jgi:hypothetical protein
MFIAGQRVSVRYEGQWAITPCSNCKEKGHLRRKCPKPCSACNTRCQDTQRGCPGPAAAATTTQNGAAPEGSSVQPHVQSVDEHEEDMHEAAFDEETAAQAGSHQPTPVPVPATNVPTVAATANPDFPSLGEAAAATDFTAVRRKRKNGKKKFVKKATLQLSDPSSSESEPESPPRRSPSPSSPKAKHAAPANGAKPRDGSPPSNRPR